MDDLIKKKISNNLKKLRLVQSYTQEEVAVNLGVSTHAVSRWECGITLPDVTMLPKIARLYCVKIADLYEEEPAVHKNYAQLLASVYEITRDPLDFARADNEFKKLIRNDDVTTEDIRIYGLMHQCMMLYCQEKVSNVFNNALEK